MTLNGTLLPKAYMLIVIVLWHSVHSIHTTDSMHSLVRGGYPLHTFEEDYLPEDSDLEYMNVGFSGQYECVQMNHRTDVFNLDGNVECIVFIGEESKEHIVEVSNQSVSIAREFDVAVLFKGFEEGKCANEIERIYCHDNESTSRFPEDPASKSTSITSTLESQKSSEVHDASNSIVVCLPYLIGIILLVNMII